MNRSFVVHNQLDDLQFHDILSSSTILRSYQTGGALLFDDYDDLMKDTFLLLYKMTLLLSNDQNTLTSINYTIIKQLKTSHRVGKLRGRTKGNLASSYIAMKYLLDGIMEKARGRIDFKTLQQQLDNLEIAKQNLLKEKLESFFDTANLESYLDEQILLMLDDLANKLEKTLTEMNGEDSETITEQNINRSDLLKNLVDFAFGSEYKTDSTLDELLHQTCNTPPTTDQSPLSELLDRLTSENNLNDDIPETNNSESEETEVQKIDSDAAEAWRLELKEDMNNRFSPFLKEQFLSEGSGKQSKQQFLSEQPSDTEVDKRIIDHNSSTIQHANAPEEIQIEKIDKAFEEFLRSTGDYVGAGSDSGTYPKGMRSHLPPTSWTDYITKTEKKIRETMNNLDFENLIDRSVGAIDQFTDTVETLGIHNNSLSTLNFDDVMAMQRKFKSPKFVHFINKVGRNKMYARKLQYKKRHDSSIPIEKITSSHHLDLMIDDEFIGLALDIEAFENDFYDRFLQDNLLTFELIAERDRRKGPIILCYDGSGSMEGKKIEETQAHIISIMEVARIQKRKLVLIQFASRTEPLYIKTLNPLYAKAEDVMDVLNTFICGGTDFEKPLSKAAEFIESDPRRKSDILFITDGQCEISKKFTTSFMALKRKRKFKLYTIIMHSHTYQDYGDIGQISDEILDIRKQDSGNWNKESNQRLYTLI